MAPTARARCLAILVLAAWLTGDHGRALPDQRQPVRDAARATIESFVAPVAPLEQRMLTDAADGRLDDFTLLESALIAGGAEDRGTLQRYRTRVAALVAELRECDGVEAAPRRRAEAVFEFMHGRVLHGGYDRDATDLRITLDKGRFNCVSATLVFALLARQVGLSAAAVEIPGHALGRVALDEGHLDVETTCPGWFRLIDDPRRQAQLVARTEGTRPEADRTLAREVTDVELLAMIYYNRGVELLAQEQFSQAAAANAKALRLDADNATARGNLLATINNWAISLSEGGHHQAAAELLWRGLELDPDYSPFVANAIHVHHRWTAVLRAAGDRAEAEKVLDRAARRLPDEAYFREAVAKISIEGVTP